MQKITSVIQNVKNRLYVAFAVKNAKDIAQEMVDSKKYIETNGNNRSPAIDALCKEFGVPLGSAWCALFVSKAFKKASLFANGNNFHYSAGSQDLLSWFKSKGWTSKNPQDLLKWKGALLIRTNVPHNGHGHVLLVKGRFVKNGKVVSIGTLEGNTNNGGSANGDGAYELKRALPLRPIDDEWTFCDTSQIKGGSWW